MLERQDLTAAARAMYEAGQSVRPAWDQLGDRTQELWREYAAGLERGDARSRFFADPATPNEATVIVDHKVEQTASGPRTRIINWGQR